jgi:hypothetical protein
MLTVSASLVTTHVSPNKRATLLTFRMHHARERLGFAVEYLATRPGSLRERVIDAYRNHLSDLGLHEFHEDFRHNFEDITGPSTASLIKRRTILSHSISNSVIVSKSRR